MKTATARFLVIAALLIGTAYGQGILLSSIAANCQINTPIQITFMPGGGTPPFRWVQASGVLPPGVSLSQNGTLDGVCGALGLFTTTITAFDKNSASGSAVVRIAVGPVGGVVVVPGILPSGTVGFVYKPVTLPATGGRTPYTWTILDGSLPDGLTLDRSGTISGTPTRAGIFTFVAEVIDAAQALSIGQFSIAVNARLTIDTGSVDLPDGTLTVPYQPITLAASGGTPPYVWSVVGALPPGLVLSPNGVLSGTPVQPGTFDFTLQITDANGLTATRPVTMRIVVPPLTISTASLPPATAGTAYSQQLSVSSTATGPFAWRIADGALPLGLSLSPSGLLSGTPMAAGTFTFTVQVSSTAAPADLSASKQFTLQVNIPPVSPLSIQGLPTSTDAAQQPRFTLDLINPYPLPISGRLTLTFVSSAVVPSDDPAVQFTIGGRTLNFTIPANQTSAVFPASLVAIQTGTVAGTITITSSLQTGTTDITPTPVPSRTVVVNAGPPVITTVTASTSATGLNVLIAGYSTPRQVTQAKFHFAPSAGSNLPASDFTVDVGAAFTQWYQSTASTAFGSGFLYTQPFSLQGQLASGSVSVTLVNAQGSSQTVTAQF